MSCISLVEGGETYVEITEKISSSIDHTQSCVGISVSSQEGIIVTDESRTTVEVNSDDGLILVEGESEDLIIEVGEKVVIDQTVTLPEITITGVAGESINRYNLVYIESDGLFYKVDHTSIPEWVTEVYLADISAIQGDTSLCYNEVWCRTLLGLLQRKEGVYISVVITGSQMIIRCLLVMSVGH